MKAFLILFLAAGLLSASPNQILFLTQSGRIHDALLQYREEYGQQHNYELLQSIALHLLEQGYRQGTAEAELMTLLGAHFAGHRQTQYIIEAGLESKNPNIQLVSLQALSRFRDDESLMMLDKAMRSPELMVRMEAAFLMAETGHPRAVGQIEGLMQKLPVELHPLFPKLFMIEASPQSMRLIQRFLSDPREDMRIGAVLAAGELERDDLLPKIRRLATHHGLAEQEASAWALGTLGDTESIPLLEQMAHSGNEFVQIASAQALYRLGQTAAARSLIAFAERDNLFAIYALGEVKEAKETLYKLVKSSSMAVKVNAAAALVRLSDPRSFDGLFDLLFPDVRDIAFVPAKSLGKALVAIRPVPSASQKYGSVPLLYELSLAFRETLLAECINLPEQTFLEVADALFRMRQNDLIPQLAHLLENIRSKEAIALLKRAHQQAGAPLVRQWATLSLYRLKEEGPYADLVRDFVGQKQGHGLIELRPFVPYDLRESSNKYQITPRETSRLLIEAFEALAEARDEQAVDVLIEALQHGNPVNRYALSGLLIRAVQ